MCKPKSGPPRKAGPYKPKRTGLKTGHHKNKSKTPAWEGDRYKELTFGLAATRAWLPA